MSSKLNQTKPAKNIINRLKTEKKEDQTGMEKMLDLSGEVLGRAKWVGDTSSLEPSTAAGVALGSPPRRNVAKLISDSAAGLPFPPSSVIAIAKDSVELTSSSLRTPERTCCRSWRSLCTQAVLAVRIFLRFRLWPWVGSRRWGCLTLSAEVERERLTQCPLLGQLGSVWPSWRSPCLSSPGVAFRIR